jgi:hypothetical protein
MNQVRETCTGRTYAEAAQIISTIYDEYVSPEQLRSALRRDKGRGKTCI